MIRRPRKSCGVVGWALASSVLSLLMACSLAAQDLDIPAAVRRSRPCTRKCRRRAGGSTLAVAVPPCRILDAPAAGPRQAPIRPISFQEDIAPGSCNTSRPRRPSSTMGRIADGMMSGDMMQPDVMTPACPIRRRLDDLARAAVVHGAPFRARQRSPGRRDGTLRAIVLLHQQRRLCAGLTYRRRLNLSGGRCAVFLQLVSQEIRSVRRSGLPRLRADA